MMVRLANGGNRRLSGCQGGSASVEFALGFAFILLPVLLGCIEFYLYSSAANRASAAADGIGRILSYRKEVDTDSVRDTFFFAGEVILEEQPFEVRLTQAKKHLFTSWSDPNLQVGLFFVDWCADHGQWTGTAAGSMAFGIESDDVSNTNQFMDKVDYVLVSEVRVPYRSPILRHMTGTRNIYRRSIKVIANPGVISVNFTDYSGSGSACASIL